MPQEKIIDANDRSVRQILDKMKYTIDVFQREYKWEQKHMEQLIDDLTSKFLNNYKEDHSREDVASYGKYYLGSIVLCNKEEKRSIIDGQQRLTSLTLLLIYLNNLQKNKENQVNIDDLIFSEKYGKKSFNLVIEDREPCMDALYNFGTFDPPEGSGESVKNIVDRYTELSEIFPEEIAGKALPYFIDWIKDNVVFVEIVTYSDDDAYTIFETMNDRGLNLTPAEMLKGYLISNLGSQEDKIKLNEHWKEQILKLKEIDKEEDLEFFKAWLRAKYADTIRPGRRGAENEDFEKIGTRFHSWVRDNKQKINLNSKSDFGEFIEKYFTNYLKLYLTIDGATREIKKDLESIYYVSERGLARSFYAPNLLSPIKIDDEKSDINKKMALIAKFLEMYVVFRSVNYKTISYSSIRYYIFSIVKEVRDKNVQELARILTKRAKEFDNNLDDFKNLLLHGQNKPFIHFLLSRITSYIEEECKMGNNFVKYMNPWIDRPFEIEHIWADKFENFKDEFDQRDEWEDYRNSIGALILLPKGFNQSYGDLPYEKKISHYFGQNLLAKSLSSKCYERNPDFLSFIKKTGLPFKPYEHFKKKDILERQQLYKNICEKIYSIEEFDIIANK